MDKLQFARTMSIIRELAKGKMLTLPNGYKIGMGDDLSIGFVLEKQDGTYTIAGLGELTIRAVNSLCEECEIGMVIPERKR